MSDEISGQDRGGRGRGRNNQHQGRGNHRPPNTPLPKDSKEAVPILRYGPSNNWVEFKKKMSLAAGENYGDLGKLIDDEVYYEPPPVDPSDFGPLDKKEDPHQLNLLMLQEIGRAHV